MPKQLGAKRNGEVNSQNYYFKVFDALKTLQINRSKSFLKMCYFCSYIPFNVYIYVNYISYYCISLCCT